MKFITKKRSRVRMLNILRISCIKISPMPWKERTLLSIRSFRIPYYIVNFCTGLQYFSFLWQPCGLVELPKLCACPSTEFRRFQCMTIMTVFVTSKTFTSNHPMMPDTLPLKTTIAPNECALWCKVQRLSFCCAKMMPCKTSAYNHNPVNMTLPRSN